jgi:hypothetical protein
MHQSCAALYSLESPGHKHLLCGLPLFVNSAAWIRRASELVSSTEIVCVYRTFLKQMNAFVIDIRTDNPNVFRKAN